MKKGTTDFNAVKYQCSHYIHSISIGAHILKCNFFLYFNVKIQNTLKSKFYQKAFNKILTQ